MSRESYTLNNSNIKLVRLKKQRTPSIPNLNLQKIQPNIDPRSKSVPRIVSFATETSINDPNTDYSTTRQLSKPSHAKHITFKPIKGIAKHQIHIPSPEKEGKYDSSVLKSIESRKENPNATDQSFIDLLNMTTNDTKRSNVQQYPSYINEMSKRSLPSVLITSQHQDLQIDECSPIMRQQVESRVIINEREMIHRKQEEILDWNTDKESERSVPSTQISREQADVKAKFNFFSMYKKLNYLKYQQQLPLNPLATYIDKTTNSNLLPTAITPIYQTKDGNQAECKLRNYRLGSTRLHALAHSLQANKEVQQLDLRSSGANKKVTAHILENVPNKIRSINLSNTKFGEEAVENLCFILKASSYDKLTTLNIEGVQLGEIQGEKLLKYLLMNIPIKFVNLSKNEIGDKCAPLIGQLLSEHQNLLQLYLHWNRFTPQGFKIIAQGLLQNKILRVLDLSWNRISEKLPEEQINPPLSLFEYESVKSLSPTKPKKRTSSHLQTKSLLIKSLDQLPSQKQQSQKQSSIAQQPTCKKETDPPPLVSELIAKFIQEHPKIAHLDLSHCGFSIQEMDTIYTAIKENHTIMGIHLVGNGNTKTVANNQQHLSNPIQTDQEMCVRHLWNRIPMSTKNISQKLQQTDIIGGCWVCEGWREVKFIWKNTKKDFEDPEPVYIHFSFDKWKGDLMDKEDGDTWVCHRICPPTKIKYYFSVKGEHTEIDYEIQAEDISESEQLHKQEMTYIHIMKDLIVPQVNIMTVERFEPIEEETFDIAVDVCKPRPEEKVWPRPKYQRKVWKLSNSVFKDYKVDNDDLERKCFEFDFSSSKIHRIIKSDDQLIEAKMYIWRAYKYIRYAYKHQSSIVPIGDLFGVSQNPLTDFYIKTGLLDYNLLKLQDIDRNYVAANYTEKKGNLRIPAKALIRFQFLEHLVYCAMDKYKQSKVTDSSSEAAKLFFKEAIEKCKPYYDTIHNFRVKEFWNDKTDQVFKNNFKMVQSVYEKYTNAIKNLKGRRYLTLTVFLDFVDDTELASEGLINDRDPAQIFQYSMMTQINELDYDRHIQMNFPEFMESIGRLAAKLPGNNELYLKLLDFIQRCGQNCMNNLKYEPIRTVVVTDDIQLEFN